MEFVFTGVFLSTALAVLLATLLIFFKQSKRTPAFAFTGLLMYSWYSKWLSALYQSLVPSYNFEIGTKTEYNSSPISFLAYNIAMILGVILAITALQRFAMPRFYLKNIKPPSRQHAAIGAMIVFGVMGLEYINLIITNKYAILTPGVDRYNFWSRYSLLPLNVVFGELVLFVPLLIMTLKVRYQRVHKPLNHALSLCMVAYFVFLLAYGQKFHGLIIPGLLIYGFIMYRRSARGQSNFTAKTVLLSILALSLLLLIGYVAIAKRGIGEEYGALSAFYYRILILQGGPVWAATAIAEQGTIGTFGDLFTRSFLTNAVGSLATTSAYAEKGVNFALALPSALILVVPAPIAAIVSFFYGVIYGVATFALWRSMALGRVYAVMAASYVLLWIHTVYASGSLYALLDPKLWIGSLFLFVALAIPARKDKTSFEPSGRDFYPVPQSETAPRDS